MELIILLWLTCIAQVMSAPTAHDARFKGVAKPFTLTPRTKMGWRVPVASSGRNKDYPEVLEYSLAVEGRDSVDIRLVRDLRMGIPTEDIPAARRSLGVVDSQTQEAEGAGFYRDDHGHGSFACRLRKDTNSDFLCDIYGLVTFEDETCFILPGSDLADCTTPKDSLIEYLKDSTENVRSDPIRVKGDNSKDFRRQRRQASGSFRLPEPGHRTIELAFVLDARFMDTFYQRHPRDTFLAEMEAKMLITLTTTEMNVYFSSLNKASNGDLDIYVHPAVIVHPVYQENFNWSSSNSDGTYLYRSDALITQLQMFTDSGFTDKQFDHVIFITGYDYSVGLGRKGSLYVGFAYFATICTSKANQFSFMEFDPSQMAYTASHEVGHALAADHDENVGCEGTQYVMSQYMISPLPYVVPSSWEFSPCSAKDIHSHLKRYPDCTANSDVTDAQFRTAFCSGLLGETLVSTDVQCQQLTGWPGSSACNVVDPLSCSQGYRVTCMTPFRTCSKRLPQVWNGTPCGDNKMCFKGQCVWKFDICPGK